MTEEAKKIGDEIRKCIQDSIQGGLKARGIRMTAEEAKRIILEDPDGNIIKRMEAIAIARYYLGENCTMKEIWNWAEGGENNEEETDIMIL